MREAVPLVIAGVALGLFFYGGLWWTVNRASMFRRPGLSMLSSMLLRIGVALGGFYFASDGDWVRLLLCLMGFVLARLAVTWLTRSSSSGIRHAP